MNQKRHVCWRRVIWLFTVIAEIIAVLAIFLVWQESAKGQLLEVKQIVIRSEGLLPLSTSEICVFRLNDNRYVYYLNERKSPSVIRSREARRALDKYIGMKDSQLFTVVILIIVGGFVNWYIILKI